MILEKFLPDMYDALGGFLALIVVNCIILGRAEAFANKHNVLESAVDGLANGIGFTLALTIMGIICEFIGSGSLFGLKIMSFNIALFSKPAGSFIVYGLCIAIFTYIIDTFMRAKRVKEIKEARQTMLENNVAESVAESAKEEA
jgi:electron transport complex protein RnfE